MKRSRKDVQGKASKILNVQFDEQPLTAFSGLIVFQRLFIHLGLKEKLRHCLRHLTGESHLQGNHHLVVLLLIVHRLLGFRELRDIQYYRHDDMVKRTLGLNFLPDISTVSRRLASAETPPASIEYATSTAALSSTASLASTALESLSTSTARC